MKVDPSKPWQLINGIPRDFWIVHEQWIGQFITENKLTPISKEAQTNLVIGSAAPVETVATKAASAKIPIWWYGGMKAAHLHFKGNVYVLQPEQWAKFNAPILDKLKAKLNAARTVNFQDTLEISEAVNQMV